MVSLSIIFSSKKDVIVRNFSIIMIFLLFYVFLYDNILQLVKNDFIYDKIERYSTERHKIAVIYIEDTTECLFDSFIKPLAQGFKNIENSNSPYDLHVFVLQKNNQSHKCNFSDLFVTNIFIDNQTLSSQVTENLMKYINENDFISAVILQKHQDTLENWKLTELGVKLSSNISIYYLLYPTLINPNLETISLVRHIQTYSRYLIVMTWSDYHTLVYTYGIAQNKILYIPHGVSIPRRTITDKALKSNHILMKYTEQDFVLLSTDIIHSNEDFKQLLTTLKLVIENISHLQLLIISKESMINSSIILNFFETVKILQLENRITWINESISTEELDLVYRRANAYISFSSNTISTLNNLLNAMAYSLPIISTSHILAIEILKSNRGLIISFDNNNITSESIIKFIKNPTLMNRYGKNAQEFVKNWSWNNIIKQYTILFQTKLFTNTKSRKNFIHKLADDPYENESILIDIKNSTYWTNHRAINFDHQDIISQLIKDKIPRGIYVLYVDPFLQLNIKINDKYQIEIIGLKTVNQYVVVNRYEGIDEFIIDKHNFTNPFQINYTEEKIFYRSINIHLEITRSKDEITIYFLKINRFLNPFGLIGTTLKQKLLFKQNLTIETLKWSITNRDIFSHAAEGQQLSINGIEDNIFILSTNNVLEYLQSNSTQKIQFIIEGSYIDGSSAHCVNRRMFLSIVENKNVFVYMETPEKLLPEHDVGLESLITYSLYLRQNNYWKLYQNIISQQLTSYKNITILFRGGWPLNTKKVSNNEILIHQEPIEFFAVPKSWIKHLENDARELWIPSQANKDAFIANGLSDKKIHVIPHGVFTEKYQRKLRPLTLPTKKKFKFLSIGGMVGRKGFDILLDSYLNSFSNKDDVTLIIHAIYGDGTAEAAQKKLKTNSTNPEIVTLGYYMSEMDLIRLFRSVDVYVSPYRGEGFGLTILEAMAAGLPPIVTKYGPAVEFCPQDCGYFIEAKETECRVGLCGNMTIFGEPSAVQAKWAEPSVQSLSAQMRFAYTDQTQLKERSNICQKAAEHFSWDKTADKIFKRISEITK